LFGCSIADFTKPGAIVHPGWASYCLPEEETRSERNPNIVTSGLSGSVTRDGITVDVNIVRLEDQLGWTLEVVNAKGTSTVWDDLFNTDEEAYAEFLQTVSDEGIATFLDQATIIPFRR